jgi:2,3-bisphosphoglycerate-independent phosphoglycerate mutase
VPFILANNGNEPLSSGGSLRDIAPTMLGILEVAEPSDMTGRDLRVKLK